MFDHYIVHIKCLADKSHIFSYREYNICVKSLHIHSHQVTEWIQSLDGYWLKVKRCIVQSWGHAQNIRHLHHTMNCIVLTEINSTCIISHGKHWISNNIIWALVPWQGPLHYIQNEWVDTHYCNASVPHSEVHLTSTI